MENKNGSGAGALEKFFAGKGFYIVLFLCAAVIGVSAWTLLSRNETVDESLDDYKPTITATLPTAEPGWEEEPEDVEQVIAEPPEVVSETPIAQPTPSATPAPTPQPVDAAPTSWLWPVYGTIETPHSVDALLYDTTMGDWRTHTGVDIAADLGAYVMASADGTVTDIREDPLYGTTVVISHGGGYESVYANLAALPTVEIGDTVSAGDTIGAVGTTAICESGQVYHLHYEMYCDGVSVDPQEYLA